MSQKEYTLEELAKLTDCELIGDPKHLIQNVSDLGSATTSEVSFYAPSKYEKKQHEKALQSTSAGAIFVDTATPRSEDRNYLLAPDPSRAFQKAIETFHPPNPFPTGFKGLHPSATIHETAKIADDVTIGPNAVIDEHVTIGNGTHIGAGTYIGPHVIIGSHSLIHPNVTVRQNTHISNHVIIQPGAVIASCGFGYTTDEKGQHTKLNHIGRVIIDDHVEIGANTTIDRGRFKDTRIGEGTKIDNLVQIAHNVQIGKHSIIVGQVGIAGSTQIGNHVILAGQVAVNGHIKITDQVIVAAKAGITKSIDKPGKYSGAPAIPAEEHFRQIIHIRNLDKYVKKIKEFEKSLDNINGN